MATEKWQVDPESRPKAAKHDGNAWAFEEWQAPSGSWVRENDPTPQIATPVYGPFGMRQPEPPDRSSPVRSGK